MAERNTREEMRKIQALLTEYLILDQENYHILKDTILDFYSLSPSAIERALDKFDANHAKMLDMIEKAELVKKEGNSLVYTTFDGEIIKKFRKAWEANVDGCLDKVMSEYGQKSTTKISNVTSEEDVAE